MKKLVLALVIGLMVFQIAGCGLNAGESTTTGSDSAGLTNSAARDGTEASEETFNITYAYADSEDSMVHATASKFKEVVEEMSGGRVSIDLYPNGSLGSTVELAAGLKDGTITMMSGDMTPVIYEPYGIFESPFIFTDRATALKVMEKGSEFRNAIDDISEQANIKLLSAVPSSFRMLSTNKETRSMAAIAGTKIRVMEDEIPMTLWKSLGASPTPLSIGEVYIALQQGLVEAQENPMSLMISYKFYEQQKYLVATNHKFFFTEILMNLQYYNNLPDDIKRIIDEALVEVDAFTYQYGIDDENKAREFLEENGVEYIELSDEDYAQMREAAAPVYDIIRQRCGDDMVDLLLKSVEEAN